MRSARRRISLVLLTVAAVVIAVAMVRVAGSLRITMHPRTGLVTPSDLAAVRTSPLPAAARELPLRLVDTGGVGIAADPSQWRQQDYRHGSRAFHQLVLDQAPWIDPEALAAVRSDWIAYLDRMRAYGANAVAVDLFLELITFEDLGVYAPDGPYLARHRALREAFATLMDDASERGLRVFLETDMLALTGPLRAHLQDRTGGLDVRTDALWRVYRAALEELFSTLPDLGGVVVRIGEAGRLYAAPGWDYHSEPAIDQPADLRAMLAGLLPVCEAHDALLILRSWSLGVGALGGLHFDPAVYQAALGDIRSDHLVISTKLVAGDYYSYLPLNPTLMAGPHQRLIELQARREYEGFGAFPNHVVALHAHAMTRVARQNPHLMGTYLWTQEGGPLRAGPRSLYPLHGFWLWIDANVHGTLNLQRGPATSVDQVTAQWVRERLGDDPALVAAMTELLTLSRQAIRQGLYIRPYAEQRAELQGAELPPLLWILEWDMVGGWTAVLGTVYVASREQLDRAVAEGFSAVTTVHRMQELLAGVSGKIRDPRTAAAMDRSLAYEASLLEALAWYRAAFLGHYHWLDTGDRQSLAASKGAQREFLAVRDAHVRRFGGDLDFPAYEFGPALAGARMNERNRLAAWVARGTLAILVLLLLAGGHAGRRAVQPDWLRHLTRVLWLGAFAPWRLAWLPARRQGAHVAAGGVVVAISGLTALAFSAFSAPILVLAAMATLLLLPTSLVAAWRGGASRSHTPDTAALAPLLLVAAVLLAVMAIRGPQYFWFLFWTADVLRAVFLVMVAWLVLWTLTALLLSEPTTSIRHHASRAGGLLAALALTLTVLATVLPGFGQFLHILDEQLVVLPMTFSVQALLAEYLDQPRRGTALALLVAAGLAAGGLLLRWLGQRRR